MGEDLTRLATPPPSKDPVQKNLLIAVIPDNEPTVGLKNLMTDTFLLLHKPPDSIVEEIFFIPESKIKDGVIDKDLETSINQLKDSPSSRLLLSVPGPSSNTETHHSSLLGEYLLDHGLVGDLKNMHIDIEQRSKPSQGKNTKSIKNIFDSLVTTQDDECKVQNCRIDLSTITFDDQTPQEKSNLDPNQALNLRKDAYMVNKVNDAKGQDGKHYKKAEKQYELDTFSLRYQSKDSLKKGTSHQELEHRRLLVEAEKLNMRLVSVGPPGYPHPTSRIPFYRQREGRPAHWPRHGEGQSKKQRNLPRK